MDSRYDNIQLTKNVEGRRYYVNNFYPETLPTDQDLYIITVSEDRYDLLAYQYYGDQTLWWVIPSANSLDCDSLYPPPGIQLRIPVDITAFMTEYKNINL